jgi:hypothetical protein
MATEKTFEVDGVQFRFKNHFGGTEEIFAGGQLLSSVRSAFGARHVFDYDENKYEVKVKVGLGGPTFAVTKNGQPREAKSERIPPLVVLACVWPLALLFIGGAVGGGLGGAAAGLNFSIYKSKLPASTKIVLNIATGFAAVVIWLAIAIAIQRTIRR